MNWSTFFGAWAIVFGGCTFWGGIAILMMAQTYGIENMKRGWIWFPTVFAILFGIMLSLSFGLAGNTFH